MPVSQRETRLLQATRDQLKETGMSTDEQRGPNPPNAPNPNARLRELLSIPERLRTDAQWDEIIEIEISQGPKKPSGNVSKSPNQSQPRQGERTDRKPQGMVKHMRKRRPGPGSGSGSGGSGGSGPGQG